MWPVHTFAAARRAGAASTMTEHLPDYDDLPEIAGLGVRHAWDVFGEDDVLGSINLVTPERVARAAASVTTGELIPLDLPLDVPDPPLFGRRPYEHHVVALNRHEMDDHLDDFHPQGSTQWDALSHVRCREHGYWGGRTQDPTGRAQRPRHRPLGRARHRRAGRADRRRRLAGRARSRLRPARAAGDHRRRRPGHARPPRTSSPRSATSGACAPAGSAPTAGSTSRPARSYAAAPTFAGLYADEEMARTIWNAHPAALCCDNPAVEVVPGDPAVGSLHRRLLPTLGTALGEMFDFERLGRARAGPTAAGRSSSSPPRSTCPAGSARPATPSPSADGPDVVLDLRELIRPGDTVVVGQATAEPRALVEALIEQRHDLAPLRVFVGMSFSGLFRAGARRRVRLHRLRRRRTHGRADEGRRARRDPRPLRLAARS